MSVHFRWHKWWRHFIEMWLVTIGLLTDLLVHPFQFSLFPPFGLTDFYRLDILQLFLEDLFCNWNSSIVQYRQDLVFAMFSGSLSWANLGFGFIWPLSLQYFSGFFVPFPPFPPPLYMATCLCSFPHVSNTGISSSVSAMKLRQFPTKIQFSNVLGCHLASSNSA